MTWLGPISLDGCSFGIPLLPHDALLVGGAAPSANPTLEPPDLKD